MAKRAKRKTKSAKSGQRTLRQKVRRLVFQSVFAVAGLVVLLTLVYGLINPPTTPYMFAESRRVGGVEQEWVDLELIAPVMARSAVAAEDANFCWHWGLDVRAIRDAVEKGRGGASTISQQTIKNLYLWQGRSWSRKAIEAFWTPVGELLWSKRRVLELYLNIAEFDEGVFGVQAASRHYFDRDAFDLSARQAGLLAAMLPNPKERNAANPTRFVVDRAARIADGAATIAADGRADCFAL